MYTFEALLRQYEEKMAAASTEAELYAYWYICNILKATTSINRTTQKITATVHETLDRKQEAEQDNDAEEAAHYAALLVLYERAWREIVVAHLMFLGVQ